MFKINTALIVVLGVVAHMTNAFGDCDQTIFSSCGSHSVYCEGVGEDEAAPRSYKQPGVPANAMDPTLNIIRNDIKYYLEIGGKSGDIGMSVANACQTVVGLIPMGPIVSGAMSIFGLAGLDWGMGTPPTIIDMTELFNKFEKELMSEVEQTTAKSVVEGMKAKYEGLTRTIRNLDGCTDMDLLKDYLAAVDTSMNELQGEFKVNSYV